jgi:hypothetical protein
MFKNNRKTKEKNMTESGITTRMEDISNLKRLIEANDGATSKSKIVQNHLSTQRNEKKKR